MRIMEFTCKETNKHYSFEKEGTPKTSDYLEVRYNAHHPAMDTNYSGPAIERVFGTSVNALELLLIERKIKGPGWLDVKNVALTAGRFAWCQQIVSANCCIIINNIMEKTYLGFTLRYCDATGGYFRHGQYITMFPRES